MMTKKTAELKAMTKVRAALVNLSLAEKIKVLADGLRFSGLSLYALTLLDELDKLEPGR